MPNFLKNNEEILIPNKKYLVPCLKVKKENIIIFKNDFKNDSDPYCYIPVFNQPHSDKENGQPETHYHLDDRFISRSSSKLDFYYNDDRPLKSLAEGIIHIVMIYKYDKPSVITHPHHIANSKLKHKCIYKGKCPHRGYNLTHTEPDDNGIITCPLHGLQFKNNILINNGY